jgi:hypothetical protein
VSRARAVYLAIRNLGDTEKKKKERKKENERRSMRASVLLIKPRARFT